MKKINFYSAILLTSLFYANAMNDGENSIKNDVKESSELNQKHEKLTTNSASNEHLIRTILEQNSIISYYIGIINNQSNEISYYQDTIHKLWDTISSYRDTINIQTKKIEKLEKTLRMNNKKFSISIITEEEKEEEENAIEDTIKHDKKSFQNESILPDEIILDN